MYTGSYTGVYTLIQILQNKVLKPELILPTLKLTYLSPSQDLDSLSEWYQGVCVHMSGWKASGTDVVQVLERRVNRDIDVVKSTVPTVRQSWRKRWIG